MTTPNYGFPEVNIGQANPHVPINETFNMIDALLPGLGGGGPTGPAGPRGLDGEAGAEGEPGTPGPRGADGPVGATGPSGPSGPALFFLANDGVDGTDGNPGIQGTSGTVGATGVAGPVGAALFFLAEDGAEGERGPPGSAGATGPTGPAGGGGGSATTVEVNLGATAKWAGKFTITDAGISGTSKVLCWQAPGPYTGKGTRADEAELQPVKVTSVEPAAGSAVVKWETPPMVAYPGRTRLSPNFGGGTAANSGTNRDLIDTATRINKVRGNVKFSYLVFT